MGFSGRMNANRLYYIGLFTVFGILIALCTSVLTYHLALDSMEVTLAEDAEDVFNFKIDTFEGYTAGLERVVGSLRDNVLLQNYLEDPGPDSYATVAACFRAIANTNPALMQVRYIDEWGVEKIRADWPVGDVAASLVPLNQLQDKKNRYYFKEASQVAPFTYWYSKLDLNIENGMIETPEKPVLRIASPVYFQQQFRGIVIINVHVKDFLNTLLKNSIFEISLIDRDGYYLVSSHSERSWSRYRESGYRIENDYPEYANGILHHVVDGTLQKFDTVFVGSMGNLLQKDGAMLLLHVDQGAMEGMKEQRQKTAAVIVIVIVLFSVPLALLISRGPTQLHKKISFQNRSLTESIELIDRSILRANLDLDKKFQDVSSAFASSLGMSKNAIIGMNYDTLYCQWRPKEYYNEVWACVAREGLWTGELQHAKSNGEWFWADTVVRSTTDDNGDLKGYSLIYQDITDKKRIEELSITDEMTGLYNRRFFNVTIKKELGRARREQHEITFAMLDIDFFKQYNDNYGHQKGDEAIKEVSAIMRNMLSRGSDSCFRLGGEEFGLLIINQNPSESVEFIESIRTTIQERAIEHKWSAVADVITVSIGLLTIIPGESVTVDTIYKIADEALYAAKGGGRNRVVAKTLT